MITIGNEQLQISINKRGAELTRILQKQFKLDYLWSADPAYWGKHAPVLFPIVGTLKDDTYFFEGQPYHLSRHGFSRERDFTVLNQTADSATFELLYDEETLAHYPFLFSFRIHYRVSENKLTCIYNVCNQGSVDMYFSVGGHPAFNIPLENGLNYTDYYLEFSDMETTPRWPLSDNLIGLKPKSFLESERVIRLSHDLFAHDAVVLKHLRSGYITLKSDRSVHGLTMRIGEFPYLGVWAAPKAPFVCIEPWQGIADSVDHNQNLEEKEGIVRLNPAEQWQKSWDVTFF